MPLSVLTVLFSLSPCLLAAGVDDGRPFPSAGARRRATRALVGLSFPWTAPRPPQAGLHGCYHALRRTSSTTSTSVWTFFRSSAVSRGMLTVLQTRPLPSLPRVRAAPRPAQSGLCCCFWYSVLYFVHDDIRRTCTSYYYIVFCVFVGFHHRGARLCALWSLFLFFFCRRRLVPFVRLASFSLLSFFFFSSPFVFSFHLGKVDQRGRAARWSSCLRWQPIRPGMFLRSTWTRAGSRWFAAADAAERASDRLTTVATHRTCKIQPSSSHSLAGPPATYDVRYVSFDVCRPMESACSCGELGQATGRAAIRSRKPTDVPLSTGFA